MVKICGNSIVIPLSMIFRVCLVNGIYPSKWKKFNICPVHKKDSKNITKNYGPISLLPVFDKIFEKIIHDTLYNYLNCNHILNNSQSGFSKGDSCVAQLLAIVHNINKNLDVSLLRTPEVYFWICQKHSIKFGTKDSFLNLKRMVSKTVC